MFICENCKKEHDSSYASGRFCSKKCAKGFSTKAKRKEINEKVSKSLKGHIAWNKLDLVKRICKECNHEYETIPYKKLKYCSRKCASIVAGRKGGKNSVQGKRSKNEIYFAELCSKKFTNVITNKAIFNGWDADIIIKDLKIAVLWNGRWHYEKITKKHSIKQVQNRDKIKLNEIKKCGYNSYIIKDMGKYNPKFVEKEFKKFICEVEKWSISLGS